MAQEIIFPGDELMLLNALDRSGCVLTDDGKFYCDLENDNLPFNSRLPVRFRGTYAPADTGWRITYSILPANRSLVIGLVFVLMLVGSLAFGAGGAAMPFGILTVAMIVNFLGQKSACMRRFENKLLHGRDLEL